MVFHDGGGGKEDDDTKKESEFRITKPSLNSL
jgi:hypothetical protein